MRGFESHSSQLFCFFTFLWRYPDYREQHVHEHNFFSPSLGSPALVCWLECVDDSEVRGAYLPSMSVTKHGKSRWTLGILQEKRSFQSRLNSDMRTLEVMDVDRDVLILSNPARHPATSTYATRCRQEATCYPETHVRMLALLPNS